jgi:hypothetical protein
MSCLFSKSALFAGIDGTDNTSFSIYSKDNEIFFPGVNSMNRFPNSESYIYVNHPLWLWLRSSGQPGVFALTSLANFAQPNFQDIYPALNDEASI